MIQALPKSVPKSPLNTEKSSTNSSARPASCTVSATSVASTATSGHRELCAAVPSPRAGGSSVAAAPPRITTPHQMLDASVDEMCALVARANGPSADELAKRAEYRATYTAKDAPPLLGSPEAPPSDLAALPLPAGRLMRAMFIALGHLFGS